MLKERVGYVPAIVDDGRHLRRRQRGCRGGRKEGTRLISQSPILNQRLPGTRYTYSPPNSPRLSLPRQSVCGENCLTTWG